MAKYMRTGLAQIKRLLARWGVPVKHHTEEIHVGTFDYFALTEGRLVPTKKDKSPEYLTDGESDTALSGSVRGTDKHVA